MLAHWIRSSLIYCLALAALLVGCSRADPHARYVPSEQSAELALKAALEAWKDGAETGPIADKAKPQVVVVDSWRESKRKLQSYQILGEVPGDTPRCYAVRVNLSNPDAEERVRFVVVGIDPLWVFRYEDFQLVAHWDHRMPEEQTAKDEDKATKDGDEPTEGEQDQPEKPSATEAAESEPAPE